MFTLLDHHRCYLYGGYRSRQALRSDESEWRQIGRLLLLRKLSEEGQALHFRLEIMAERSSLSDLDRVDLDSDNQPGKRKKEYTFDNRVAKK